MSTPFISRRISLLPALLLVAGCSGAGGDGQAAAQQAGVCRILQRSVSFPEQIAESSGAAFSRRHAGVVWTHEDSGNEPEVFALSPDGRLLGRVRVSGARNQDWEDMAVGPCGADGGDCLYLADIGDNQSRKSISLWRVREPAPGDRETGPAEEFRARYPGGRTPDSEAVIVFPNGEIYLVTKGNRDPVELFRWPTPLQRGPVELVPVRALAPRPDQPGDRVTGASVSPDGRWVAIRTYGELAFFRPAELFAPGGKPALEMDLTVLGEGQGEAVALGAAGQAVLTSEGGSSHVPGGISRLACTFPGG